MGLQRFFVYLIIRKHSGKVHNQHLILYREKEIFEAKRKKRAVILLHAGQKRNIMIQVEAEQKI